MGSVANVRIPPDIHLEGIGAGKFWGSEQAILFFSVARDGLVCNPGQSIGCAGGAPPLSCGRFGPQWVPFRYPEKQLKGKLYLQHGLFS